MTVKKLYVFILIVTMLLFSSGCSQKNNNDVVLSNKDEKNNILVDNQEDGIDLSEEAPDNTDSENTDSESKDSDNTDSDSTDSDSTDSDSTDIEDTDIEDTGIEDHGYREVIVDKDEMNEDKDDTLEAVTDNNSYSSDSDTSEDSSQMDNEQAEFTDTSTNQDIEEDEKLSVLEELSRKLALQMSRGEFKETHDTLSPLAKLQISLKALEQAWKDTVADIGNYKSVREIRQEASGTGTAVYLILDYDNSGIQILFSYNTDKKLDGLWISFAPYESIIDDGSFEELTISFGDKQNPIEGIFTLPKNNKPPVVILVHGSGNHDADETIGVNKPFRDLAHGLARKGVAVIRYKENVPKSFDEFTIEDDSLYAASQAIKYAQGCGKVDTDKIIVVGHSLGGMMAPKIAADNKEVDGIVCLAGSPRRLEDIILDQVRILTKAEETITEAMYKLALAQTNALVKKVKDLKASGSELILGYPASYWYSLNQIDIPSIVKDLDIPIYIAQGSKDFQVYADIDYIAWQDLLKDKNNVTFGLYDNLNHLFMTANGRMDVTEYNINGTVEQRVIDDIVKWILK